LILNKQWGEWSPKDNQHKFEQINNLRTTSEIVSKLNVKLKEINYLQLENVKLQERMDNLKQQKGPLRLEITF
jgi:regulator of replication initiation timing